MLDKILEQAQRQQQMLKKIAQDATGGIVSPSQSAIKLQHRGEQFVSAAIEQMDAFEASILSEADKLLLAAKPKTNNDLPFLNTAIDKTREAIKAIDGQYKIIFQFSCFNGTCAAHRRLRLSDRQSSRSNAQGTFCRRNTYRSPLRSQSQKTNLRPEGL